MAQEIPLAELTAEVLASFEFLFALQTFSYDGNIEVLGGVANAAHHFAPALRSVNITNQLMIKFDEVGPHVGDRGKPSTTLSDIVIGDSDVADLQLFAKFAQKRDVARALFGDFQDKLSPLRKRRQKWFQV